MVSKRAQSLVQLALSAKNQSTSTNIGYSISTSSLSNSENFETQNFVPVSNLPKTSEFSTTTKTKQTIGQWHIVFYISIVITLLSYIFFMIFGTADEQPWNRVPSEGDESKEPVDSYKNNENSDRMDSIA